MIKTGDAVQLPSDWINEVRGQTQKEARIARSLKDMEKEIYFQ